MVLGIAVALSPLFSHDELVPDPPVQCDVEHKVAPVHIGVPDKHALV
jgi:hypothetical protein